MSGIDLPEELRRLIEEVTMNKLNEVRGKTETLIFVDSVIDEVKRRGVVMDDDTEAKARPYVVDILWTLRKRGVIAMDDDLLHFSLTRSQDT
ncbi:MAG: hypothetical protein AT716_05880 [Vulcanisaeta sp. MG_3]|jgi:hypothetical protein|nr:MAG: hypothetical protein AT716_05880 [Vulcanisaeta sp. MG_3]